LRAAISLYVEGRYKEAAAKLRPLIEKRALPDRADHLEALRTYGIALYLSGSRAGAERAFRELLRRFPSANMDPSFVRPEVVDFFEKVKERFRRELDAVVKRSAPQGSALLNLLPPWGQLQNRHRTKAYIIGGTELALGAVSIVSASLLYSWRGPGNSFGQAGSDRYERAKRVQTVNVVATAALAAVIAYGIVDGLYHYFRQRRAKLPRATVHLERTRVGPSVTAGGAAFRF
jgi:tetratricopeptide (TPR) repeat protein